MAPRRLAPVEVQPKSFAFFAENLEWARAELTKYPQGRQESAILSLLWRAQAQSGGWLPEAAIRYVADDDDAAGRAVTTNRLAARLEPPPRPIWLRTHERLDECLAGLDSPRI